MKKLKNLGTLLTRSEQKWLTGGTGTCAVMVPAGTPIGGGYSVVLQQDYKQYGMSYSQATSFVSGVYGAHWCCDSCGSASWYTPGDQWYTPGK